MLKKGVFWALHTRHLQNGTPPPRGFDDELTVGSNLQYKVTNQFDAGIKLLGRTLPKFTQLKRNKRFDNFIMLVWVQGSPFHIDAVSHPVQKAWGSQDSLYRDQI